MRLPILNFVVFALLLFSVNCFCQDENGNSGDSEIKSQKNSHGVQFYLINGLSISYKKMISNNNALRFNLDLSGSVFDRNDERDRTYMSSDTTEYSGEGNYTGNRQSIALSFQYIHKLYQNDYFNAYIGGGPYAGYSRSKDDSDYENSHDNETYKSYSNYFDEQFNLGILGVVGAEGFISEHVGVFAEYKLFLSRSWYKSKSDYEYIIYPESENNRKNEYNSSSNSWDFTLSNVKLGVSIYF
jgi:hypothetical protein